MSAKSKRLFKRIVSYSGIFFFALAAGMLWWQLRNYTFSDIAHAILDIPLPNLVFACISCLEFLSTHLWQMWQIFISRGVK